MNKVIGISGKIGSGKTTLGRVIADKFGYKLVGFGDYIRHEAIKRGITPNRVELQNLGQSLFQDDALIFCKNLLQYGNWDGKSSIIIDGIRHLEILKIFKTKVQPLPFYLIYIDTKNEERLKRLSGSDLEKFDMHPTESDVKEILPSFADLIVDGSKPSASIENIVTNFISNL